MVEQTEWDPTEFENKKKADSDDSDDDDDQDYDSDDDTEYDRPSRPAKSEFISATSSTTGDVSSFLLCFVQFQLTLVG